MQPQTELIRNICDKVQEVTGIDAATNELTDDGRIYLEIGAAVTEKKYTRGPSLWRVPVMFAGPNKAARYQDGNVLYSCMINFKISY